MKKILIVDDEKPISDIIKFNMVKEGYEVVTAFNGREAIELFEAEQPDIIILDLMLPEIDGLEVAKAIRKTSSVPIIMLSAKDSEFDKVIGLELGADDYVTKPFSVSEIRARVAAHIRRENRDKHIRIIDYPISCDLLSKKIYFKQIEIDLTKSEYEICELLLKNRNQVFTKEKIYTTIYGYDAEGDSSTSITERIKKIREKFAGFHINPVKTIWGVGYQWEVKKV